MDVAQIPNVMDHLSVELITVPLDRLGWGAVQSNVMVTLTAQVENAMLNTINVIYGQSAARIHLVLMGREIVIITLIVKEHFSVALTTVQEDQPAWTAVSREEGRGDPTKYSSTIRISPDY